MKLGGLGIGFVTVGACAVVSAGCGGGPGTAWKWAVARRLLDERLFDGSERLFADGLPDRRVQSGDAHV